MGPVGEPPGAGRHRRRTVGKCLTLALAAALVLTSCTYSESEPGLFRTEAPVEEEFEGPTMPPEPTNRELPVAGETVWTSSEGLRVTARFAVHAVRRMAGATILDWSITPISAPDLDWGEQIPSWIDFGLGRSGGGDLNALLIDAPADRVYRPLQHRSRREFNRCLCSPLWVAQLDLRIGETRLLQATYPKLPPSTRSVDVAMATLPVFENVPVTPENRVPTALGATDLSRPPVRTEPLSPPSFVRNAGRRGAPRVHSIQINAIESGPHFTSLHWTIRSVTDHPSIGVFPPEPPITAVVPPSVELANASAASGPQLQIRQQRLGVRWITARVQGRGAVECLCTSIGLWATSLREAGGRATVTTVFDALPAGVQAVDVVLPTATTLWRLPVKRAADSATRLGPPRKATVTTWVYREEGPPPGWKSSEWPTPIPDPAQLRDYAPFVEEFAELPGS